MSFRCTTCGHRHEGLPDMGMEHPDPFLEVPEGERGARTSFTPDHCSVRDEDGEHYFVRGVMFLPVHGQTEPFGIGAWVSQSRTNFERYVACAAMEPTFGWLVNRMKHHAKSTFLLECTLHFHGAGERPTIELSPSPHPLCDEQRRGISLERAWTIVHHYVPS